MPGSTVAYPFRDTLHQFHIKGDSICRSQTESALDLLKRKAPNHYRIANQYIGEIECVEDGSGMKAWSEPPTFLAGKATREGGTSWYASTIVHDACHSKQYHDHLAENPNSRVPTNMHSGSDAEAECLTAQLDALTYIGASHHMVQHVRNVIETEYWEIPPKERYW